MATATLPRPETASANATDNLTRTLHLYTREARFEILRALRNKGFTLSILGFPIVFYCLFGVMNSAGTLPGGQSVAKYLLASYAAFGMVGAALFGIGVGLALERTSGWLELKRASPMPPFAYLAARCVMAIAFSMVIVTLLSGIGIAFAGVHLSAAEYGRMLLVTIGGSVPFAGLGLLLAMLLPANAAPGIANMIYLPMSYCSGLWMPLRLMPRWIQHLAHWLPTYHLAQVMLSAVGYGQPGDSVLGHVLALAGFTVLFLSAAAVCFRRAETEA